jgi:hypothetical protein
MAFRTLQNTLAAVHNLMFLSWKLPAPQAMLLLAPRFAGHLTGI